MKRRINALSSSTSKATKKRSWKDEDSDDDDESPAPRRTVAAGSDSDENGGDKIVGEGIGKLPNTAPASGPNPVMWMEISVAGTRRGRLHFELFKDAAPQAAENFRGLCNGQGAASYKGTEFLTVVREKLAEGGEVDVSIDLPPVPSSSSRLGHAKGGLLSAPVSSSFGSTTFQLTFGAMPELDDKRVVFGQLVGSGAQTSKVHPLHWIEAVGTSSGTPREAVVVEDCGECDDDEADELVGLMVRGAQIDGLSETQEDRYSRAGVIHGKLADAVDGSCLEDALELTEDLLEHLEYQVKKAKTASDKATKIRDLEVSVKALASTMEELQHKAGEVNGFENTLGSKAKGQMTRVQDLVKALNRQY